MYTILHGVISITLGVESETALLQILVLGGFVRFVNVLFRVGLIYYLLLKKSVKKNEIFTT